MARLRIELVPPTSGRTRSSRVCAKLLILIDEPGARTAMSSVFINLELTATEELGAVKLRAPVIVSPEILTYSSNPLLKSVEDNSTAAPTEFLAFRDNVFVAPTKLRVGLL